MRPIAIVGGGPCGLSLARLLHLSSIPFTVFERDTAAVPNTKFQGGTLDIHGHTGQELLRRAGIHDQFEKYARRNATTMAWMDWKGRHRQVIGEGRDAPEIDRSQLRQILLDSVPASNIQWDKTLGTAQKTNDGWTLKFRDGSEASGFRLVVGADGAWSKLRQLATSERPVYSGKTSIEGSFTPTNPVYDHVVAIAGQGSATIMGTNCALIMQRMSDDSYRTYMSITAPESYTKTGGAADVADADKARKAVLNDFYSSWDPEFQTLIQNIDGPFRSWPLYRMNPDSYTTESKAWKHIPGVTLLGDAAHLSTPNGEGVNEAMYDALRLFDAIQPVLEKGDETVDAVIQELETEAMPRNRDYIQRGVDLEKFMFGENAARDFLKNLMAMHPDA